MWKRLFLAVFILLCFEVGLFLMMFPWSSAWDRNYFLSLIPFLRNPFQSSYFRGAVSGLGLANVWLGLGEAWRFRDTVREMEISEAAEAARLKDFETRVHAD